MDEEISHAFEPHAASLRTRLAQMQALIAGGVPTEARLDPILPTLTAKPVELDKHFAALAQVGVKRAAAGVLFLRSAIRQSLEKNMADREMLVPLLGAYREEEQAVMRGAEFAIQNLSSERRREIFARLQGAADAHGIELSVCACKNADIARGSCNIAGTWARRPLDAVQLSLVK